MRVVASDGLNSSTATSAPFALDDRPPRVRILSPLPDAVIRSGAPMILAGAASDPEDGTITDAAVSWESDIDGPLGSGRRLDLDNLSVGRHDITLVGVDTLGHSHTQPVAIEITD